MKSKSRKRQVKRGLRKKKGVAYFSYSIGEVMLRAIVYLLMYIFVGITLFSPIFLMFL